MDRAGPIAAFILLALSAAFSPQVWASESFLLRWIPPPESDVAGYNVYLAAGCAYPDRSDIALYALDPSGIASSPLALPEDADEYHVMLTAYTDSGAESPFSNVICLRTTTDGADSCVPWTDCRRPEAPTAVMLDLWYAESFLNETTQALRPGAGAGLLRRLDRLEQLLEEAGVWVNADKDSLRAALKIFAKVVRGLRSAGRMGADPVRVSAAEDATLNALRMIAQREVAGLACWGDESCGRRRSKVQEKIWKGDTARAKGGKVSAASHYAGAFIRASRL